MTEPGMSQHIKSCQKSHNLKRCNIQNYGSNQTEKHKQSCSSRVSPAQQRLQPLPLSCQVTNHSLNPPCNTSQSIISHPYNIRRPGSWKCIEFFIQFIRMCRISMGETSVHVWRMPWPPSEVPNSNQEKIEENCG